MTYRTTIILFIIALALSGAYFFYIQPGLEEKKLIEDFEKTFFRADTSEIEFIRLDAGQGPITISKSGESWKITSPSEYEPDLGAIESLFKSLAAGRLIKVVGNAGDIDAFGFETTYIILTLGYRGTIDVLRIAGESPSALGHYAFSERLGKIFLVDKDFVKAINLKPLDLREKRLFVFEKEDVGRIKLQRVDDTVELVKKSDGWQMVSPLSMKGSVEDIENLVETLHTRQAEAFLDWDPAFSKLEKKIFLELFNTEGLSMGSYDICFRGSEWDKGTIVHLKGSGEASRVRRDFWLLLDDDYSKFAYRNMADIDTAETRKIMITSGSEHYVIEKKDVRWFYKNSLLPDKDVLALIDALNSWKAEKFIYKEWFSLGGRQLLIEVVDEDGTQAIEVTDSRMDHEMPEAALFFQRKKGEKREKVEYFKAYSSNLDSPSIISSEQMVKIMDMVRNIAHE